MLTRRIFLGATLALATALTGCSSDNPPDTSGLPDGPSLLKDAATASRDIKTAHFTLKLDGKIAAIPVQNAEGDLSRDGGAKGTVKLTLLGQLLEGEFVLVSDSLYIKGPTGGFQKYPASLTASLYDPAAILNPDKGVANVLGQITDGKTEAKEDVDGTPTFKVKGMVKADVVSAIVPGVDTDVSLRVWVRQDTKALVKAQVELPGSDGKTAKVELTLSDLGKQVTIAPPA